MSHVLKATRENPKLSQDAADPGLGSVGAGSELEHGAGSEHSNG
jgi:hypothetical protein